ncbi:MAG: LysR family transcriptional regulator [Planctomycetota bacterium]|jgi:DNA-binding transcriptional LysR family regulator|nr:LysR family transcriptional regulator [Planctomycetota bacterium]
MAVEPRRLLEFLAIAKAGSFSAAAENIHVSQPALSQSMAMLERELGVQLIERGRHGARLNSYGRRLEAFAAALECLMERAEEEIYLLSKGIEGKLVVGVTPITAVDMVPNVLGLLVNKRPNISVSMVDGLDDDLQRELSSGHIDLVVGRIPFNPEYGNLKAIPLRSSTWELIMHAEHPLAQRKSVSLLELSGVKWVLPARGSVFRRNIESLFMNNSVPWPMPNISTNSVPGIKAIIMMTDHVSLMAPELINAERKAGYLTSIALDEAKPFPQELGLMMRGDEPLPPIAQRFSCILRKIYGKEE